MYDVISSVGNTKLLFENYAWLPETTWAWQICHKIGRGFVINFEEEKLRKTGETGKMPVFHTKTIESILEPVAQQVIYLIISTAFVEPTRAEEVKTVSSSHSQTRSS
jgi:hypothetical protein